MDDDTREPVASVITVTADVTVVRDGKVVPPGTTPDDKPDDEAQR